MTTITGLLKDSGRVVFGAELTVTLDAPLLDGASLLTKKPRVFSIPGTGVINFELTESETSQITYKFELRDLEGDYVIPPFHAVVPNIETVNFWELYPVSAVTDLLPAGLRRLAQIIATNPQYADALKGFRPEGDYDPDQFYSKGSLVSFSGGSFLYVADTIEKGKNPGLYDGSVSGNPVYWQALALKGESSGLAPSNDVFDRTLWIGNTQAPTKNSLASALVDRNEPLAVVPWGKASIDDFDGLELLTLLDLLDHFAVLYSPDLAGDPKAPTKGVGDATRSIATCAHVKASIDALASAYLTQVDAASTYLTQSNAASTYATQVAVIATFLTQASASSTYLSILNAAATYLTQASAAATYAPRNNPTLTGTVAIPQPTFNLNDTTAANVKYVNERLRVFVTNNTGITLVSNTQHTFTWSTESIDYGSNFNPANGQWTCPATGYYRVFLYAPMTRNSAAFSGNPFKIFFNVTDAIWMVASSCDVTGDDYTSINGITRCTQGKVYDFRVLTTFSSGAPFIAGGTANASIEFVSP